MPKIKTVGELVEALKAYPAEMPVGVYIEEAEEGGAFITELHVQNADDDESLLYHKGDNPLSRAMAKYVGNIKQMLTICSRT